MARGHIFAGLRFREWRGRLRRLSAIEGEDVSAGGTQDDTQNGEVDIAGREHGSLKDQRRGFRGRSRSRPLSSYLLGPTFCWLSGGLSAPRRSRVLNRGRCRLLELFNQKLCSVCILTRGYQLQVLQIGRASCRERV